MGDEQPDGLRITRAIYRGRVQTPKTHHSVRMVALPESVREDLSARKATSKNTAPDDGVFPSENGKTPLWANNEWYDKIRSTLDPLASHGSTTKRIESCSMTESSGPIHSP